MTPAPPTTRHPQTVFWLMLLITLAAFALRVWQLDGVPPGWRDDELINSLVISQKVLDGDWAVYYADASGHEALYHALNAVMLGLFGPNIVGIRLLSAFLGTLTVALTYRLGQRLFGADVGVIAAAALTVSFWSLMYSRIGLRHVLTPPLALASFYFFWQGLHPRLGIKTQLTRRRPVNPAGILPGKVFSSPAPLLPYPPAFFLAAFFMALGFYTYFAARGVPMILLAFCGYLALFVGERLRRHWRGVLLMFVLTAVLALPLVVTLSRQPESEARVAELAVPLLAARDGDFAPLLDFTTITLSMFHSRGDNEWLYNIPDRPLFGAIGALLFWLGVATTVWLVMRPLLQQRGQRQASAAAFLLLWWLAGISPAFISVPPASLGHTILAQPATFLLAALPLGVVSRWRVAALRLRSGRGGRWRLAAVLAALFVGSVALRDGRDYFVNWPQRGMVRFLYRADIAEVADYVNANPGLTDVGMTGLLAGPWDRVALAIDLQRPLRARWYNPQRALLLQPSLSFSGVPNVDAVYASVAAPVGLTAGDYELMQIEREVEAEAAVCWQNGLCVVQAMYDAATGLLELVWLVQRPLQLPPTPLISNPPPPGVYAGPRLAVFAQRVDAAGNWLAGDDGLWVDPTTLHVDDLFLQQHRLGVSEGDEEAILFGLYDPMTGERILTVDGRDHVRVGEVE